MLARSWPVPEAIAIWVELVEERKKEIEAKSDPNELHGLLARATAQQEISRAHLAAWDASARAWLRNADEVKRFEQTQLRLIIQNSGLPVSNSGAMYSSVIEAWTTAMTSLQKLILGIPQNISKGSILLGLLSWHIYPDLNVVEPTANIQFHDPFVGKGGVVTLGLHREDSIGSGVHWSLALSHLRFYGDPVPVERSIGSDNGRLTLPELHLVALGSLISSWSNPAEINVLEAANCFVALGECLSHRENGHQKVEGLRSNLHWLELLIKAAGDLLASTGTDREHHLGLIDYGRRRGRAFLNPDVRDRVPLFGLANPLKLFELSDELAQHNDDAKASVAIMRRLAAKCQFNMYDSIIRYVPVTSAGAEVHTYEYTTAIPIPRKSGKRNCDGQLRVDSGHISWAYIDPASYPIGNPRDNQTRIPPQFQDKNILQDTDGTYQFCTCATQCYDHCGCKALGDYCGSQCSCCSYNKIQADVLCSNLRPRQAELQDFSEDCRWLHANSIEFAYKSALTVDSHDFTWFTAPSCFVERYDELFRQSYRSVFKDGAEVDGPEGIRYRAIAGTGRATLFLSILAPIDLPLLSLPEIALFLRSGTVNGWRLIRYLDSLALKGFLSGTVNCLHSTRSHNLFMRSLQAMAAATELYSEWPEATLSIEVTRNTLGATGWAQTIQSDGLWLGFDDEREPYLASSNRSINCANFREPYLASSNRSINRANFRRASKFACIALLESGTVNVYPEQVHWVFAMACGNSIYVDDALLQDPSEVSWGGKPMFRGIRRILGNLDRPGLVFLVPPQAPRIRDVDVTSWKLVPQASFNGTSEDLFKQASLHLNFTDYEIRLGVTRGGFDAEAVILEAFVSLHNGRQWVADLDILRGLASDDLDILPGCRCGNSPNDNLGRTLATKFAAKLRSIENWDDLLCCRDNLLDTEVGVMRTYSNPYSRLAAAAVCARKGYPTVLLPSHQICPDCSENLIQREAYLRIDGSLPLVFIA
jgi:hypothetical protein